MKKTGIIISSVALVIVVGAVALLWPKQQCDAASGQCADQPAKTTKQEEPKQQTQPVNSTPNVETIQSEVKAGAALLIDVREPDEWAAGHAENAQLIPLGDIEAGKFNEPDKTKKIYLYCRTGRRAEVAKNILNTQGYASVENLGGLSDWQSLGGKTIK